MINEIIKEQELENQFREYLKTRGYQLVERRKPQGIDIEADNKGIKLVIEVEGSQKPDGNPLTTQQLYTHFYRAVGQICKRMTDDKSCKYILLIPYHEKYLGYVAEMKEAVRRLKLNIIVKKESKYFLINSTQEMLPLDLNALI